jgi:hypothetical protein
MEIQTPNGIKNPTAYTYYKHNLPWLQKMPEMPFVNVARKMFKIALFSLNFSLILFQQIIHKIM